MLQKTRVKSEKIISKGIISSILIFMKNFYKPKIVLALFVLIAGAGSTAFASHIDTLDLASLEAQISSALGSIDQIQFQLAQVSNENSSDSGSLASAIDGLAQVIRPIPSPIPPRGSAPEITAIGGPNTILAKKVGRWTVTAQDTPGSYLTYNVVSWGDGEKPPPPTPKSLSPDSEKQTATFSHIYLKGGKYTAKFKVTDETGLSHEASITVTVKDPLVETKQLTIEPQSIGLSVGKTASANAFFNDTVCPPPPPGGLPTPCQIVNTPVDAKWFSDDKSVAVVEKVWCVYGIDESLPIPSPIPTDSDPCSNGALSYGLITGVGKGKTTIQALYTSGNRTFTAKTAVKVKPLPTPQRSIKILSPNDGEWGIGTRQKVAFSYSGLQKTDYLVLQLIGGPTPADIKVINPVVEDAVEITVPTFPCREDYCEPNMEPGAYVLHAVVLDRAPCSLCPGPEYIPKKLAEDTSDGKINIVKTPTPSKYKFQAGQCVSVTPGVDVNVREVGEKELPPVIGSVKAGAIGAVLEGFPYFFKIGETTYRFWHVDFKEDVDGLVIQSRLAKCPTPKPITSNADVIDELANTIDGLTQAISELESLLDQ